MDHAKLRHVLAVARTGSFSRAAGELHITQPALSRSIASFESQHGVRLFDRSRTGVTITGSGKLVVEQARAILSATGDLERSLRLYACGDAGRVAIGFGPLLASLLLPSLTQTLLASRPGVQLLALIKPVDQLLVELANDAIEMVLANSWQAGQVPGLVSERVGELRLAMIVRAGHPLAGRKGLVVNDLAEFPVATAVAPPAAGLLGTSGALVCDNFHILRDTVLLSNCVWLSAPAFVADYVRQGRLVELKIGDLRPDQTDVCFGFRKGRTRSPIASAVCAEIRTILDRINGGYARV